MLLKVIYDKGWPHGKHNRQTACDAIDIYQQTGVHKVYLDHTDMVNSKNRWCISQPWTGVSLMDLQCELGQKCVQNTIGHTHTAVTSSSAGLPSKPQKCGLKCAATLLFSGVRHQLSQARVAREKVERGDKV